MLANADSRTRGLDAVPSPWWVVLVLAAVVGTGLGCASGRELGVGREAGGVGHVVQPVDSLSGTAVAADSLAVLGRREAAISASDSTHDYRIRRASGGRTASIAKGTLKVLDVASNIYVDAAMLVLAVLLFRMLADPH
jgi:hypothetical protein